MTKTRRMMETHIGLVDLVIELLDARIPQSSKNPDIDTLAKNKPRIIILTKSDMADPKITARWEEFYRQSGFFTLAMNLKANKKKSGIPQLMALVEKIMSAKIEHQRKKGRLAVPVRVMVVGIPNVGKSTFINLLAGKAVTAVADKPGVTRGRQWIAVKPDRPSAFGGFDLLDTPGVLWPKFEDPQAGLRLAVTGAISDTILDKITLAEHFITLILQAAPATLFTRYPIPPDSTEPRNLLTNIGEARGYKIKGGAIDLERTAIMLLDEFRGGKLGRITLEVP
jgi:ribosome biogenesis GTPase A